DKLRHQLSLCNTYPQWRTVAQQLDRALGNDNWKADPESSEYDHRLIHNRLSKLRNDRLAGDVISSMYSLRSGLLRNLGGISDPRLYCTSYVGTKRLIQEYTREVVDSLNYIATTDHPDLSFQARLDFFHETKQSFGCSALILEGGATFGLYHIGVVKALHEQQLLPRVISGSAVGALIAALVCIHSDDELQHVLRHGGINLSAFEQVGQRGTFRRKLTRWLKYGHALDVKVLEDCVRSNVGDVTFEEAFHKTRRILNITVSSARPNEVPKVLNYLTAPNVLIWSAACASTAATYPLYSQVHLLAKDDKGIITKWSPADITWTQHNAPSSSFSRRSAASELFNVNHLIVSQAGALAAPMVLRGWRERHSFLARVASAILMEVRHRTAQAAYVGLVPSLVARWIAPETITGDVTITPELTLEDYRSLFSNPTNADMDYWMAKGERSTWPLMSLIKNRCIVEFALDRNYQNLRTE
ncbi:hypothetical protein BCR44DRAFT_115525, partial [Catenaria anguillulae PL171]